MFLCILQISCRLFAFDSVTSSWKERGRGGLRVNDRASNESNDLQSRVIVRSKGSLRVMLNTNVWSDMKVDRTSDARQYSITVRILEVLYRLWIKYGENM